MNHKTEIPAADTRVFGAAIRKALKQLGLPYKVRCRTVSFGGFGYGTSVFAGVDTGNEGPLTSMHYREIGKAILAVRELPEDQGGGVGIVSLHGMGYPMGGSIGYKAAAEFKLSP